MTSAFVVWMLFVVPVEPLVLLPNHSRGHPPGSFELSGVSGPDVVGRGGEQLRTWVPLRALRRSLQRKLHPQKSAPHARLSSELRNPSNLPGTMAGQ